MDFPITINPESGCPLWKQLSVELSSAITARRLQPGAPLPPTRQLAQLLSVSRDTVVRAYEELVSQGYAEARIGAGTFVRCAVSGAEPLLKPAGYRTPAPSSDYAQRVGQVQLTSSTSADLPKLNYGAAPADHLPAKQWREIIMRHAALQDSSHLTGMEENFGFRPLREAIASYLRRSKALTCTADQIIVFSDSQHALDMIGRLYLNPGDGVVVENPGYCGAREHFASLGAALCPVPVDEDGLITSALEKYSGRCKLAYVSPYHHDPTGAVMSQSRRKELLSWAQANNVLIAEDAFDSDYRYGSQPELPLQAADTSGCVVYIYSFWKLLYPITATGCLVLPPDLIDVFSKAKLLTKRNYSLLEHYALAELLTGGHLERHIRKTRASYSRRRQNLIYMLSRHLGLAVSFLKESAGLHLLVRISCAAGEADILRCADEAGLPMVSTNPFYVEQAGQKEFLIPFACLSEEQSSLATEKFAQMLAGQTT